MLDVFVAVVYICRTSHFFLKSVKSTVMIMVRELLLQRSKKHVLFLCERDTPIPVCVLYLILSGNLRKSSTIYDEIWILYHK